MKQTYETGLKGEETAEKYLHDTHGMYCLERRYRSRCGEIDLIMQEGETIVFVEVKTRLNASRGTGLMTVNSKKQQRIARAAAIYLMNTRQMNKAVRFDVVEISQNSVIHISDAFQPGAMFYR